MNNPPTPNHILPSHSPQLTLLLRTSMACVLAAVAGIAVPPALAADGCKVLLCLAAPKWRSIPECVPPIQEVMRDLARGKPFPICHNSGGGNSANHNWAGAPGHCPPQYTRVIPAEGAPTYACDFTGEVSVSMNGTPFTRTWWNISGDTVTEFSPAAKALLGTWDTRFEDDLAAWSMSLQPTSLADAAP
jgi:hypothetical protein